jgi:hypothetical protein
MAGDKWLEILVGVVILGGLGFLTEKVMDIKGTLGGVEAKVSSTSERVERIAQALPDVGVRVAEEEINKPIRTIVLASVPLRQTNGKYIATVNVIDTATSKKWTTSIPLASKSDKAALSTLAWSGFELDRDFVSLSRMQEYARVASADVVIPADVDTKISFVLGSTAADDYLVDVRQLGFAPASSAVSIKLSNWKDISAALKDHQEELTSKQ